MDGQTLVREIFRGLYETNGMQGVIILMLTAAAFEELLFRVLPIRWAVKNGRSLFTTVLISSLIFGFVHFLETPQIETLVTTTVLGVAFSLVYLFFGGRNGNVLVPWAMATAVHAGYNLFALAPLFREVSRY